MINLDDIAALPHGEGKAVALSLWNRLQIVDKAFRMMCAEFDYSELKGDKMYRAYIEFAEGKPRNDSFDEQVLELEREQEK